MHERGLVEQWEYAIEIFKKVLEQGKGLFLWREGFEDSPSKNITKNLWFPVHPLIIINVGRRDHVLE